MAHAPLPLQPPPDQESKLLSESDAAERATSGSSKAAVQVRPHEMPSGLEPTAPGVKTTPTVQWAPAASDGGQSLEATEKLVRPSPAKLVAMAPAAALPVL